MPTLVGSRASTNVITIHQSFTIATLTSNLTISQRGHAGALLEAALRPEYIGDAQEVRDGNLEVTDAALQGKARMYAAAVHGHRVGEYRRGY